MQKKIITFSLFLFKTGNWHLTYCICSEDKLMRGVFGAFLFNLEDVQHCFLGQRWTLAKLWALLRWCSWQWDRRSAQKGVGGCVPAACTFLWEASPWILIPDGIKPHIPVGWWEAYSRSRDSLMCIRSWGLGNCLPICVRILAELVFANLAIFSYRTLAAKAERFVREVECEILKTVLWRKLWQEENSNKVQL